MSFLTTLSIKNKNQKGQALLLVLLAMAAILIVTLSVATRSVTDVSVTTAEENALRAFSAAEAGIENTLLTGFEGEGSPNSADPNLSYNTKILTVTPGLEFVYPSLLDAGESATFWFVGREQNGEFTCADGSCLTKNKIKDLCWGVNSSYPNNNTKPAVLLTVFYDWNEGTSNVGNIVSGNDFTHLKVARVGFDPYTARGNDFDPVTGGTCTIDDTTYRFHKADINFNTTSLPGFPANCFNRDGCLIMAKARVFYNATPEEVAIQFQGGPGAQLPAQGNTIESVGVAGESTRKVQVFQSFSEPPSIFDAAVFSLGDFTKN